MPPGSAHSYDQHTILTSTRPSASISKISFSSTDSGSGLNYVPSKLSELGLGSSDKESEVKTTKEKKKKKRRKNKKKKKERRVRISLADLLSDSDDDLMTMVPSDVLHTDSSTFDVSPIPCTSESTFKKHAKRSVELEVALQVPLQVPLQVALLLVVMRL